ncbi:hypothetical protein J3A83DRAFT_3501987 [Scleroderma citrinum]
MDGLSAAATVIQVVETSVTVLAALSNYTGAVMKADQSRSDVVEEVKSFRDVLAAVKTQLSVPNLVQNTAGGSIPLDLSCLWAPAGPLTQCERISGDLLVKLETQRMRWREKVAWPFKVKKVTEMVERLRRCKHDMNLFLEGVTLHYVKDIHHSVTASGQKIGQVEQMQLSLGLNISTVLTSTASPGENARRRLAFGYLSTVYMSTGEIQPNRGCFG